MEHFTNTYLTEDLVNSGPADVRSGVNMPKNVNQMKIKDLFFWAC